MVILIHIFFSFHSLPEYQKLVRQRNLQSLEGAWMIHHYFKNFINGLKFIMIKEMDCRLFVISWEERLTIKVLFLY